MSACSEVKSGEAGEMNGLIQIQQHMTTGGKKKKKKKKKKRIRNG